MDALAERILTDYVGAVEDLKTKLLGYVPPSGTRDPPDGVPAETRRAFPYVFGRNWPVHAVAELPPVSGRPRMGTSGARLRAIRLGTRHYYPALTRRDSEHDYEDGRDYADMVTTKVWSTWLAGLQADEELEPYEISIAVDKGDMDRVGNPFFQPGTQRNTILWVRATDLTIEFP